MVPENDDDDDSNSSGEKSLLSSLTDRNFDLYADYGLLSLKEVKEVASRITYFNNENEEIAIDSATIDRFLYGVGSHHAGQLPAHKAFAESLFRVELMKVVFATETLAAGINMPARTTVICSMAKRGKDGISLLDTANLLQMAGRAGRRGMDTDGTCVISATSFEGPDDAVSILTNEIKPVVSQFSPSYSLAINLIARGAGRLDVARNLVRKSFAMWEKQQIEESVESLKEMTGDVFNDVVESASHERFLDVLKTEVSELLVGCGPKKRTSYENIVEVLNNKQKLKRASKTYIGLKQIFELEGTTLNCLKKEAETLNCDLSEIHDDGIEELLGHDMNEMKKEIETQNLRVEKTQIAISEHVFTQMAIAANTILQGSRPCAEILRNVLLLTRSGNLETYPESFVTPEELTKFAKSASSKNRQRRRQKSSLKEAGFDSASLLEQMDSIETSKDDAWEDMLALNKVLEAYGCIKKIDNKGEDPESHKYAISEAGQNIGFLGFENSLWCLVAMGGAWDVMYESSDLDKFRASLNNLDVDTYDENTFLEDDSGLFDDNDAVKEVEENIVRTEENGVPISQSEAGVLVSRLRSLEPHELAGYVSCLVADAPRGGTSSVVDAFQSLTPSQQKTIQSSLCTLERLNEVQRKSFVDGSSSHIQLELGTCEVVTAWAGGCSWSEAIEISGSAPGDLARILNRALDALRQFGNLPYSSVRAVSAESGVILKDSSGIHPDLRHLCREAALDMDRYPLKDPLPLVDLDNLNVTAINEMEEEK